MSDFDKVRLEHASLDTAVQALKGAPYGRVHVGIARPVTEDNSQLMLSQLRDRLADPISNINTEEVGPLWGFCPQLCFYKIGIFAFFKGHLFYRVFRIRLGKKATSVTSRLTKEAQKW